MFELIPTKYYQSTALVIAAILSLFTYMQWMKKDDDRMLRDKNTNWIGLLLYCLLFVWIVGNRPIFGGFGDTYLYAHQYSLCQAGNYVLPDTQKGDWLFNTLMISCSKVMDVHAFFTIVEAGYIFFALWGLKRIFHNNTWGAWLFFIGAFSFFSYGTNGIRNGLACSIVILAFSFLMADQKWEKVVGVAWCLIAISVHKSTLLPCAAMVTSLFVRNPKVSVGLWIFAIALYLVAGNAIADLFASLGFDDRMTSYENSAERYAQEYKSGFRADFLLYSAMPIWLGYEVLVRKKVESKYFPVLFNTYIFANAFWVMVMGAAYSNRFAYLSWFMYPLVLAYPCLQLDVWGSRQGKVAGNIMLAHIGFTLFMTFIYYR